MDLLKPIPDDHPMYSEAKAVEKMTEGYNRLRDALIWFDSHEVEKKLGHLPQWVVMGRNLTSRS